MENESEAIPSLQIGSYWTSEYDNYVCQITKTRKKKVYYVFVPIIYPAIDMMFFKHENYDSISNFLRNRSMIIQNEV